MTDLDRRRLLHGAGVGAVLAITGNRLSARAAGKATTLTGTPRAPTTTAGTSTTQRATTASVETGIVQSNTAVPPSGDTTGAGDAANLLAAAAAAGPWTTISLMAGTYYVNETILCSNNNGITFTGQGKLDTKIIPVGARLNGVAVFKFVNCRMSGCRQMWIHGNAAAG
jgi:hypothetical protein